MYLYATFTCPNFHFQSLSMTLFLNIFFELDPYSDEYLHAKLGVDTAESEPLEVWRWFNSFVHSPP